MKCNYCESEKLVKFHPYGASQNGSEAGRGKIQKEINDIDVKNVIQFQLKIQVIIG